MIVDNRNTEEADYRGCSQPGAHHRKLRFIPPPFELRALFLLLLTFDRLRIAYAGGRIGYELVVRLRF